LVHECSEANLDADFVIVGMHRSFYGSTYASDSVAVRATWQKIFDRYGVDLVLSGHDHIYARSHSIYNDAISADPIREPLTSLVDTEEPKTMPLLPMKSMQKWLNSKIAQTSSPFKQSDFD
jgi:3',5'-cyclic AMP phosphodiesterase CpdA